MKSRLAFNQIIFLVDHSPLQDSWISYPDSYAEHFSNCKLIIEFFTSLCKCLNNGAIKVNEIRLNQEMKLMALSLNFQTKFIPSVKGFGAVAAQHEQKCQQPDRQGFSFVR